MSQLDTLLQARLAQRRQQGPFWSSSGRGILVIAALNIVLLWSVTGGVIWQSYRDAVDDWKRTAANFSLTTAAYAQQTLVATDLMAVTLSAWRQKAAAAASGSTCRLRKMPGEWTFTGGAAPWISTSQPRSRRI